MKTFFYQNSFQLSFLNQFNVTYNSRRNTFTVGSIFLFYTITLKIETVFGQKFHNLNSTCYDFICRELDVFIADQISLAYESLNDPSCRLKVVGDPFAMSGAAIAVKKGSPWFAQFNEAMQKLKSKGLTDFIQKFWVKKYRCIDEKPPTQLKIRDLSGLFLQLAIAVVVCFLSTLLHRTIRVYASNYRIQRKRTNSAMASPKLHRLVKSLETNV